MFILVNHKIKKAGVKKVFLNKHKSGEGASS